MTANEQTINYLNQRVQALEKALKHTVEMLKTTTEYEVVEQFKNEVDSYENRNKTK